jgi:hypothetical protein
MIKNDTIRTQLVTMEKVHYVTRIESADGTDHEVLFHAQQSGIPMFPFISQRLKRSGLFCDVASQFHQFRLPL